MKEAWTSTYMRTTQGFTDTGWGTHVKGGGNPVQGSFYVKHVQIISAWLLSDTTWAAASV